MAYKILTKNGIENTNIDGARNEFFNSGMRSGIVQGALNEGSFLATNSNTITLDTCELRISGHRVLIDSPVSPTFTNKPSQDTRYSFIAEIKVADNQAVSFSLFTQLSSTKLIQENLYHTESGNGTYQVEIGKFTLLTNGTITDAVRTIDVITGGISGNGLINIGTVTTNKIEPNLDAEVDIDAIYDSATKKVLLNFKFQLPIDMTKTIAKADSALTKAESAVNTANKAKEESSQASSTANAANTKSDNAVKVSGNADKKSNSAVETANAANTKSTNALSNSETALSTANEANTKSGTAIETANEAKTKSQTAETNSTSALTKAEDAVTKAESAVTTAGKAETTANSANEKSDQAVNTANSANTKAGKAETTANQAKTTAEGIDAKASSALTKTDTHIADKKNPHEVTKTQVGLGNVDNTSDANKPISNATKLALDTLFKNVTYNGKTGVLTFTKYDDSTTEVDLPLELIAESGYFDSSTKDIVLVLANKSEIRIPASALVNEYYGDNTTIELKRVDGKETFNLKATIKSNIDANTAARHSHSNKSILDATTESFTTTLKNKLDGIAEGANKITNNNQIANGANYIKNELNAFDYNNLQNKPVIPAGAKLYGGTGQNTDGAMTQKAATEALGGKVSKVDGKGLSSNDFTNGAKQQITTNETDIANLKNNKTKISGAYQGFSAGDFSDANGGGAIGLNAKAGQGFSGGSQAAVKELPGTPFKYIDAIQLGSGTNEKEKTLQVYGDNLYDAKNHKLGVDLLEAIYPIGTIYISIYATSPAEKFGGTWEALATGKTLWTTSANDGGQSIEAGLPNITGEVGSLLSSGRNTGAFQNSGNDPSSNWGGSDRWNNTNTSTFNASRSSGVYGKSTTVQPPAIKVHMWKRTE